MTRWKTNFWGVRVVRSRLGKRAFLLVAGVLLVLLGSSVVMAAEPIRIGFVGPLTGGASFLGQTGVKAVELAFEEFNKAGGLNGRPVQLFKYDDQAVPAEGLAALNKLVDEDKVIAIVGPFNSSVTLAVMATAERKQVPLLTTAVNTKILSQGNKFVFRTTLDNEQQGLGLADYVIDVMKMDNIAIIYGNDDFGNELQSIFDKRAKSKGVTIVANESYNPGTTDFYGVLTKIKPKQPQAIILCGYIEEGSQILRQSKELGIETKFFSYGAFADDLLLELAGDAAEGVMMITLFEPGYPINDVGKHFVKEYRTKYNEEANSYSGESYGSALVLLEALRTAKTLDGKGVRDALAALPGVEVPLGVMSFDEKGQSMVKTLIGLIQDGKRVLAPVQPQ